ncbi:MAG: 16S rRNA (guanine(527)-N(7))-methyltransferase RsmG [Bacteroidota bacterium]
MLDTVFRYFDTLSDTQKKQFQRLGPLYETWNQQINVISRKDIDELYIRHVLHSLGIAKIIDFKAKTRILDVGTGGGFPGIPLAILFPEAQFHLVDSIGKKIKVVNTVANELGLNNVSATQIRAEQVQGKYHFVISRAVTRLKPFYQWIKNKFEPESFNDLDNGLLYLKGGDLTEELKEAKKKYQLFDLSDHFKEEFFETKKVVYISK